MDFLMSPEVWISLVTLTVMEIVLGIDNIVFISILTLRLPKSDRARAQKIGLILALLPRLVFLACASWIASLTTPIFSVASVEITGKSLILLTGGLFLIYKATHEIHDKLEADEHSAHGAGSPLTFSRAINQIVLLNIIFSIDSVITAVGMSSFLSVMFAANILAMIAMIRAARGIAGFVEKHPTVKMLGLAFLLLIGFTLTVEAVSVHIPKGYVYFAMAFSVFVETLNIRAGARKPPVVLHNVPTPESERVRS